jgi:hypothetical protein
LEKFDVLLLCSSYLVPSIALVALEEFGREGLVIVFGALV